MRYEHKYGLELEKLFAQIGNNRSLVHEFLYDLLSPAEYKDLAVRLQIVKQLRRGVAQRDIAKNLKVSVATVTRGSREMMNKKGGFKLILDKFYPKKSSP